MAPRWSLHDLDDAPRNVRVGITLAAVTAAGFALTAVYAAIGALGAPGLRLIIIMVVGLIIAPSMIKATEPPAPQPAGPQLTRYRITSADSGRAWDIHVAHIDPATALELAHAMARPDQTIQGTPTC